MASVDVDVGGLANKDISGVATVGDYIYSTNHDIYVHRHKLNRESREFKVL